MTDGQDLKAARKAQAEGEATPDQIELLESAKSRRAARDRDRWAKKDEASIAPRPQCADAP